MKAKKIEMALDRPMDAHEARRRIIYNNHPEKFMESIHKIGMDTILAAQKSAVDENLSRGWSTSYYETCGGNREAHEKIVGFFEKTEGKS